MRRRQISFFLLIASVLVVGDVSAAAEPAVRIQVQVKDATVSTPPAVEPVRLTISSTSARFDTEFDEEGNPALTIEFRGPADEFLILFHEIREATTYDRAEFQRYMDRRRTLTARAFRRLNGLEGAENDAKAKEQLSARDEAAAAKFKSQTPTVDIRGNEETGEYLGFRWAGYDEYRNGRKARQFQVASWEELGLEFDPSPLFQKMDLFLSWARDLTHVAAPVPTPFEAQLKVGGMPLVSQVLDGEGEVVIESKVTSIELLEDSKGLFGNPDYPRKGLSETLFQD